MQSEMAWEIDWRKSYLSGAAVYRRARRVDSADRRRLGVASYLHDSSAMTQLHLSLLQLLVMIIHYIGLLYFLALDLIIDHSSY